MLDSAQIPEIASVPFRHIPRKISRENSRLIPAPHQIYKLMTSTSARNKRIKAHEKQSTSSRSVAAFLPLIREALVSSATQPSLADSLSGAKANAESLVKELKAALRQARREGVAVLGGDVQTKIVDAHNNAVRCVYDLDALAQLLGEKQPVSS